MVRYDTGADLQQWVERVDAAGIPVLLRSVHALERLRALDEDRVDAQTVSGVVLQDPLMSLKVLRFMAQHRSRRQIDDVLTVDSAVLLIGVPPFLRHFSDLQAIEVLLSEWPMARDGALAVIERSYRSARLALGYAVHRGDVEAALLYEAALIHDFAEVLVWTIAPALMLRMARERRTHPEEGLASIERRLLGVELCDLEQALMTRWGLPERLTQVTDDRRAEAPRVQTVLLATRIARHHDDGWRHADAFDDLEQLSHLLGLSAVAAQRKTFDLLSA